MENNSKIRNRIYKYALYRYTHYDEYPHGLCHLIDDAASSIVQNYDKHADVHDKFEPYNNLAKYPELALHEPKHHEMYWFHPGEKEPRIEILKHAIANPIPDPI